MLTLIRLLLEETFALTFEGIAWLHCCIVKPNCFIFNTAEVFNWDVPIFRIFEFLWYILYGFVMYAITILTLSLKFQEMIIIR